MPPFLLALSLAAALSSPLPLRAKRRAIRFRQDDRFRWSDG